MQEFIIGLYGLELDSRDILEYHRVGERKLIVGQFEPNSALFVNRVSGNSGIVML